MARPRGEGALKAASQAIHCEVLARNDLGEPILATPALAGGRLYVRTEGHLYAFGE